MGGIKAISGEGYEIISMAYNSFLSDLENIKSGSKYAGAYVQVRTLGTKEIDDLCGYLKENDGFAKIFVIDMEHVVFYPAREFEKFWEFTEKKIVFWNISNDSVLQRLNEDLNEKYLFCSEVMPMFFSNKKTKEEFGGEIEKKVSMFYQTKIGGIVHDFTYSSKKGNLLESSGVFSNFYVNTKELFEKPDELNLAIFGLLNLILDNDFEMDALVSASRNGAVLANILGWLLNKKVVHCTSLGPKYAVELEVINQEIRSEKKYLYVFDFLCLGSEAKALNILLGIKNAKLVGGVGISNYISFDTEYAKGNIIGKMKSLVQISNCEVPYMIAGNKKDLEILQRRMTDIE